MSQRVLKIILPLYCKQHALEILNSMENTSYWQEESSMGSFVVSALTEFDNSETIMDQFEQKYSSTEGFKLIVFPVEASLPRTDSDSTTEAAAVENGNGKKKAPSRISREELYADIVGSTKFTPTFILMTILSTIVVAIGLQNNNVAVIIGAMVIAPFLGPNVALALATCLADNKLARSALKTLCGGIGVVTVLAMSMGYIFKTGTASPEILLRTNLAYSDILLAVASGCAGVLAFTTGASSAVIGVMVAVALLPPLCVAGLLLGAGHYSGAVGALLLFLANIISINLAGVLTFLFQGVSPRNWWQAADATSALRKAIALWSFLLILLILIMVYRSSL